MNFRVMVEVYLHPDAVERLSKFAEIVYVSPGGTQERAILDSIQGAIVGSHWHLTFEEMSRMPALKVIARPGIGIDNVDIEAATRLGIAVVNSPDGPTESTAEHAVAFLLALAIRLKPLDRLLPERGFEGREPFFGTEVKGKVLGVIGLGRIGGRVAQICSKGLGMRVLTYDPYISDEHARVCGAIRCESLEELLRAADFVSLHVPSKPETHRMINARTLAMMKPGGFLINVARGALVDETALLEALRSGHLAGAALDVFDPEPPALDNPLLHMDNVLVTPHMGALTHEGLRAMGLDAVDGTIAVLRGKKPRYLVNPEVWDSPSRRA